MQNQSLILSILSFAAISACSLHAGVGGHDVLNADVGGGGTSYKYDITCNRYKTGSQNFSSKGDYCAGLLDEGRNKSNCRREREDLSRQNCQ